MFEKKYRVREVCAICILTLLVACGGSSSNTAPIVDESDTGDACDSPVTELSSAFLEFVAAPNVTVVLSENGCTISLESAGKPDHTSSYWDSGNEADCMLHQKTLIYLTSNALRVTLKIISTISI